MAVVVQNRLAGIHSLTPLFPPRTISEIASITSFIEEPLTRFMYAATSLNLLTRDAKNRYALRSDQTKYSAKGAEVLFLLIRSAPHVNSQDTEMVAAACSFGLIEQSPQGYRLSAETKPFLNPASPPKLSRS